MSGEFVRRRKTVEQSGAIYENVPKTKQKEAVDFLNKQLFATPIWIADNKIYDLIGGTPLVTIGQHTGQCIESLV
jgi:hypothetical protein